MNTILGGLIAIRGGTNLFGRAVAQTGVIALKLNSPAMGALLDNISNKMLLNSKSMVTFTRFGIGISGVASTVLSYIDATNAFELGNNGEGYSHIAIGSGTLLMTLAYGYAAVTTTTAAGAAAADAAAIVLTGAALTFFWAGVLIAILGTAYILMFSKDEFENLLQNCFWGNGKKYSFWSRDDIRPKRIEDQFRKVEVINDEIRNAFLVEYQEFANLFTGATLKREFKDKKTIYRFTLPNFQWGKSEIFYQVISFSYAALSAGSPYVPVSPSIVSSNISTQQSASDNFAELMEADYKKLSDEGGLTTLTVEMDSFESKHITIFWYYMPTEDVISPLRYKWNEEPILENAIYGYDDEVMRN
ncbi:hypothetical protein [Xenorhabdus mauleonii]|nr:hypothetical protein [Xenorhabdus mauleonii]SFJ31401.1 hypothetical protein SAMN05421680_107109 [Xenorhabdus mauleonii]